MAKENDMKKQLVVLGLVISILTSIFSVGGAWAVSEYRKDTQQEKLKDVCIEAGRLRTEVNKINTENEYRDGTIKEFKKFKDADAEWKILDATWKGMISEAITQSMYYGDSGKLGDLIKISDENKKNVSKKNKVE